MLRTDPLGTTNVPNIMAKSHQILMITSRSWIVNLVSHKQTNMKPNTHYQIPGTTGSIVCNLCIMQLLQDASPPWCLSCFVWIYLILSFPYIFMFVSLLPGAINQASCYALSCDSRASLPYLFTFWWGTRTSVCWEGILISCNFPALTCVREWSVASSRRTQMWIL